MPWKNPLQNSTRRLNGKKALKCRQCGACCPKSCRHLSFSEGKANCGMNKRVQKGELQACGNPPEMQYKLWHPLIGGFIEKGKRVFNCKAMQGIIDEVFGKGVYNIALKSGNRQRNWIAYRLTEKVQELLNSKSKAEFEGKKQGIRLLLDEMQETK